AFIRNPCTIQGAIARKKGGGDRRLGVGIVEDRTALTRRDIAVQVALAVDFQPALIEDAATVLDGRILKQVAEVDRHFIAAVVGCAIGIEGGEEFVVDAAAGDGGVAYQFAVLEDVDRALGIKDAAALPSGRVVGQVSAVGRCGGGGSVEDAAAVVDGAVLG